MSIYPVQHKQLFLDDSAVERMSGVKRRLHPPRKCGPVLRPNRSRGETALQSRSAPQWNTEKGMWEWWYWAGYTVPPFDEYQSKTLSLTQYARSTDGIAWETPSLGLYEWRGSKDNSVALHPEEGDRHLYHIVRDEREEDPRRRYKGLFGMLDRELRVSLDGFQWTGLEAPPIPSRDESHMIYDETSGQYLALVKHMTEWGRSVWLATSRNFVDWTEPKLIFHSDEKDRENRKQRIQGVVENPAYLSPPLVDDVDYNAEVYQMAVMPYEGLYVGFPGLFNPAGEIPPPHRNFTGINQVELAVSCDLYRWERVADRAVFIGVDPWDGVNYGTAQNLLCGRPHIHDEREIWIYYNAIRFRGPQEGYRGVDAEFFEDTSALCLAKLRLDGFVSLDAEGEGTVVTKPFSMAGGDLYVNAEAQEGEVCAELLNAETMALLPGFSAAECLPLRVDHLRGRLAWKDRPRFASEQAVRVRFVLRQAKLYAFWVES